MRRDSLGAVGGRRAPVALLMVAMGLAGCGSSQTKTVSVSSASSPLATSRTSSAPRTTTQAQSPTRTNTTAPQTTQRPGSAQRTAPAPAFTEQSAGGEALATAVAVVKEHGFTPTDTSDYHADQTLRVLIGTKSGSGDGYGQQAFFFVDGHYIGTDASEPSATLKVVGQSDTEVTLAYPLYRAHDPLCCPGGGQATVRFQLNNGRLAPLDTIPPVSSSSGPGRQ